MNLDLPKHAEDKVKRALEDVYQLTDDSGEKIRIAILASGICIGQACGFLAASMGLEADQVGEVQDEILRLIAVVVKKGGAEAWDYLTKDGQRSPPRTIHPLKTQENKMDPEKEEPKSEYETGNKRHPREEDDEDNDEGA